MTTRKIIAFGGLGLGLLAAAVAALAITGGHSISGGPATQTKRPPAVTQATAAQAAPTNPNPQTPAAAANSVRAWWNGSGPVYDANGNWTGLGGAASNLGNLAGYASKYDGLLNTWASQGYPRYDLGTLTDGGWSAIMSFARADEPPAVNFAGMPASNGLVGLYNQYLDASSAADADLHQAINAEFDGNAQQGAAAVAAFATDYQKLGNVAIGLADAINSVVGTDIISGSGLSNGPALLPAVPGN